MNDHYFNAKLFDEDILLASDKEDNIEVLSGIKPASIVQNNIEDLVTPALGDISFNFSKLAVLNSSSKPDPLSEETKSIRISDLRETTKNPVKKTSGKKRQRDPSLESSPNTSNTGPVNKKPKKLVMVPPPAESVIREDKHLVLLLPDSEEVNLFSSKHGEKLSPSVINAIKLETNPEIKFDWTGFERGRYKMVCPNLATKEWALLIVPRLNNLWEDHKIKAIDAGVIPKMKNEKQI